MKTPLLSWTARLFPLVWLAALLFVDPETVRAPLAALPAFDIPEASWVRECAAVARRAVVEWANAGDSDVVNRMAAVLASPAWLLERLDAAEAMALLFLARLASGLRLLGLTLLFWTAALIDGFIARRIAFLTFAPYRPVLAVNAASLAFLLITSVFAVLASPWAGAQTIAVVTALAAGGALNLWARNFHRFSG